MSARMNETQIKKHTKYYQLCLNMLPSQFTSFDSSRISLIFFCISGLNQLGALDQISPTVRQQWSDEIWRFYVSSGDGFRGSTSMEVTDCADYDPGHLASTYFALSVLSLLRDHRLADRLNRTRMLSYIGRCQQKDGSFAACLDSKGLAIGEFDMRYCYVAVASCVFLGCGPDSMPFDVERLREYILSCVNYDGGISQRPRCESHAGLTYCALASLKMCGILDRDDWSRTADWLAFRQIPLLEDDGQETDSDEEDTELDDDYIDAMINKPQHEHNNPWAHCHFSPRDSGGFNGRVNKPADTCYSFWVLGSLSILNKVNYVNLEKNRQFLLFKTQNLLMGGFSKQRGKLPDPLHSYLGLCGLQVGDNNGFNYALCLKNDAVEWTLDLWR